MGLAEEFDRVGSRRKKKSTIKIKPSHKGLLHEDLGVPQGEKIPADKLAKALNSPSAAVRKRANFARNFGG